MIRVLLATALALGSLPPAWSAEVTFQGSGGSGVNGEARFRMEGEIEATDVASVRAALAGSGVSHEQDPWRKIVFELSSPGGSYATGLDLALLFRREGIATVVRTGDNCFSACAIAFLGGADIPRDPTPATEGEDIPDQPPDRSLEPGGHIGFHAPYLRIPASSYSAEAVAKAYDAAVVSISRLIAVTDRLHVDPAELPRLLQPTRDDLFMADTVDALRTLEIDYTDRSLQWRDFRSVTRSMVENMCVNRWYHRLGRSASEGARIARAAAHEFIEGSILLENGEEQMSFSVRPVRQGTVAYWFAAMPVAKTTDGKMFMWCVFEPESPDVYYRAAGTLDELLQPLSARNDVWDLRQAEGTIRPSDGSDFIRQMVRALDAVPASTPLALVGDVLEQYQRSEESLGPLGR